MKVIVLGAGGGMGAVAARHLALAEEIDELVVADIDEARAAQVASAMAQSSGRVRAEQCDVLDDRRIRRLLDDAALVVNCTGPFFQLGVRTLAAALDTGTTYLDICDDPEPTVEMLALDQAARDAGVAAVVGMGASPGLSNLLAARAARRLDTVHDCITGWSLDEATDGSDVTEDREALIDHDGSPAGAVIHFMEQIHGTVPVVVDGALVRRPPLEAVDLDYPGLGRGTGYVVGHPEPITLHRSLGVTGRSCNLVLVADGATASFLRGLRDGLDGGGLDLAGAGKMLLAPTTGRTAKAALGGIRLRGRGSLPSLFAWVAGSAGGVRTTVGCHLTSLPRGMSGATSVPAALAARQLLGSPPAPGVHPPEAVIDADRLLTDLLPFCTTPVGGLDELAPVRVATQP